MSDPKVLEFSLLTFTTNQLEIKVKNISGAALDKTLVIEIYPPMYLVEKRINDAAQAAPTNQKPLGVASLAGVVSGAEGWSVWARRETSDSSLVILLINDLDEKTGDDLATPVKLAAGAEFTIRIPLNPQANRASLDLLYSYQHGTKEDDPRIDDKIELKPAEASEWTPVVTLTTDQESPTMIAAGSLVKIFWHIEDAVSATLRGPLPGGNSELTLSPNPKADCKIDGSLQIRVVSSMTYLLQAQVKRPNDKSSLQVVRMLTLDTSNKKYGYVAPRTVKVLPYGLIEVDWAAWGVKQVEISVGQHTTRVIKLTQQTLGRFFEGCGVMRVSASKADSEIVTFEAPPEKARTKTIKVISWVHMAKPDITGQPMGLAVVAPNIALLTSDGLFVAEVGDYDDETSLKKLIFSKTTSDTPKQWLGLVALDKRFVVLRRTAQDDLEVAPYNSDGNPDQVPAVNLPGDLRPLVGRVGTVFDLAAFGGRAYIVVEAVLPGGTIRRAFSVGFDSSTKKAEYRLEPLLEQLAGYRLVTFDDAFYALNRDSGQMFRFSLTTGGRLEQPCKAASAVKKSEGAGKNEQSMIMQGLIVPVGRVLAVLSPSSVPSLASLEAFGLQNVLGYVSTKRTPADPNSIPQDLVYNPQKNYWARCGHDLDVKKGAVAACRVGESPRLWVIQPDGEAYTLAVGSETLFARDYVLEFPTKPLAPYLNKNRQFTIKSLGARLTPITENYRKAGLLEFSSTGPAEVPAMPRQQPMEFTVDLKYNEADPSPITLRLLVMRERISRPDIDYMLEVTFSGPGLSTATSAFRRLAIDAQGKLTNDEVFGTRMQHSTNSPIEVPKPKRFDDNFSFVMVNASDKFRLKPKERHPAFAYVFDSNAIAVDHNSPDFSLQFEGKIQTEGEIRVNFNFALPDGIEASPSSQPQTKLIRLNTDNAKKMHVMLVKTVMPGDQPLKLEGLSTPIEPMREPGKERPVFVCQLDYKL